MHPAPYDGSFIPFTVGLKPLAPEDWLTGQPPLEAILTQKRDLLAQDFHGMFRAMPGTLAAQAEALELILSHLYRDHPAAIRIAGPPGQRRLFCATTQEHLAEIDWSEAPLALAARLVADDLVIMSRRAAAWVLAAGCVCFPSSWRLEDKFARPLEAVHDPVPGLNEALGARITRIFDHLPPGRPVMRQNWSISADPALRQATEGHALANADHRILAPDRLFIRVEHQTLRRLPETGDILFTIRIHMDPVGRLETEPNGVALAAGLANQVRALTDAQRAYKGLAALAPDLLAYLDRLAGG